MEIYNKLNKVISCLENEKCINEIKKVQLEINSNKKLLNDIKINNYDVNNSLIRKYKHLENEVNYIILEINMNLKQIIKGDIDESNSRQI